jgi:dihydroorotase
MTSTTLTITKPDDWHIHLRDGEFLKTTVSHAAKQFNRVIVMPNLKPPICTVPQAKEYHDSILHHVSSDKILNPLMTLYLTDHTSPTTISLARTSGFIFACKLYPAGSTTYSESGVKSLQRLYPVFERMQEVDLPLLIHGEVTHSGVDIFDREAFFIDTILSQLVHQFPNLRIVLEHATTKEATQFVLSASDKIAATITPHHLLLNRNDIFVGGIQPHHYCLPILKRSTHQEALIKAATSGNAKFFIGTDSAPHPIENKETSCGCAGVYCAHAAIELYTEAFERVNALDKLEGFCSFFGADFYQLPRNKNKISLIKEDWQVPDYYLYAQTKLVPFRAGSIIHWKLIPSYD